MSILLLCAFPLAGLAQTVDEDSFGPSGKLAFHAANMYSPWMLAGSAAYAGVLQEMDAPREWEQGAGGYGRRLASTLGGSAIQAALAFGLDSTLHEDPRYYRSKAGGFWRRTGHALRGTVLTRTDRGGETLSFWRLGSAYGEAYLSNQWYPDRLNTVRLDAIQGSVQLGVDFVSHLGIEFWPDLKRRFSRRKP